MPTTSSTAASYRTNTLRIKPDRADGRVLDEVGDRVSALWNSGNWICRQAFLAKSGVPGYTQLCADLNSSVDYRRLPSDIAQEVLKKLCEAWRSFFALRQAWSAAGGTGDKPGLPGYRKHKDGTRPTDWIPIKHPRSYQISTWTVQLVLPSDLRRQGAGRLSVPYRGLLRWKGQNGRAEIMREPGRRRWHLTVAVERTEAEKDERTWIRAAAVDLGVRVLASLSVEGQAGARHFSGREVLKDFDAWGRAIATEQNQLAKQGLKGSARLSELHRIRWARVAHAWEALAAEIVRWCRRHQVGMVFLGYPKNIRRDRRYGSSTWNERIHTFWGFDKALRILEKHLRRARIQPERVGERGTSSTCVADPNPAAKTHEVVRSPRHLLRCKTCGRVLHSDQAGSRNLLRFFKPSVRWDGSEAGPWTATGAWDGHRWSLSTNPTAVPSTLLAAVERCRESSFL